MSPDFHARWIFSALLIIGITLALTIYSFWRKRYIDSGPKKGQAAHPSKVRQENPPTISRK